MPSTLLVPYLVGLGQMNGTQKMSLKLITLPKLLMKDH